MMTTTMTTVVMLMMMMVMMMICLSYLFSFLELSNYVGTTCLFIVLISSYVYYGPVAFIYEL